MTLNEYLPGQWWYHSLRSRRGRLVKWNAELGRCASLAKA